HVSLDTRYDERIQVAEGDDFSPAEPLQCWIDLIAAGVDPANVRVLGVNGGNIAAFEYRLALALGATVGVIESSGRAVADLLPDVDWWDAKNLLWLPLDKDVIRAFVCQKPSTLTPAALDRAARAVHEAFVADKLSERSAPSVQPWPSLRDDFKESNRGQVAFAEEVLRTVGYAVRKATPGADVPHPRFTDAEIEKMAKLEHGRFVVERLGQGWRFGPHKDEANKVSPYLVPWADLSDNVREYDREAVRNYPNILAEARREIHRIRKGR
ncbi:hypothetical protein HQ576_00165, partial [bacterium]|nr:hypothetical protein [bacterium]